MGPYLTLLLLLMVVTMGRYGIEDRGLFVGDSGWNDAAYNRSLAFCCYKVHVVRERKTWENALRYCREHYHDLASVASETELMLMKKELGKTLITEHVWIGLHFMAGDWLWVDGQPLEYEAWGLEGKLECPKLNHGSHDCQEELSVPLFYALKKFEKLC
uniref:C-type lectin domain-containing protein n=1 Tax=Periophthalmus magnuspinnatus TaxID=409849 RepID=A0A3B4ABD1_9GOBI